MNLKDLIGDQEAPKKAVLEPDDDYVPQKGFDYVLIHSDLLMREVIVVITGGYLETIQDEHPDIPCFDEETIEGLTPELARAVVAGWEQLGGYIRPPDFLEDCC
jgi:hypothetical protein